MPAFYSPQLTPSTPSAPSVSYGYPASSQQQAQAQASGLPAHFNLNPNRNYGPGSMRMAQSGASTPVPTSPVQGPVARSSSMMDFGSYGQGQDQGSAQGQAGQWAGGRMGGGFGYGVGMGMTAGGASSPIDLKGVNGKVMPSPPPTSTHPSSFDPSPGQLGIGSSVSSGSADDPGGPGTGAVDGGLAMSISPPSWGSWGHYQPAAGSGSYGAGTSIGGNAYMGSWGGMGAGSFVGSLGQMGQSFGRERDRELEARYVKDFSCCGRQLNGLHELLEHYEEEHANLSPDARFAALSAAQAPPGYPRPSFTMPNPSVSSVQPAQPRGLRSPGGAGDAPAPPGMMDIEMDDDASGSNTSATTTTTMRQPVLNGGMGYVQGVGAGGGFGGGGFGIQPSAAQHSPWASAFKPVYAGTTGIPPSLLTMPAGGLSQGQGQGGGQQATLQNSQILQHQLHQNSLHQQTSPSQQFPRPMTPLPANNQNSGYSSLPPSQGPSRASTPLPSGSGVKHPLSQEELDARAARKAQRKADRQAQARRAAEAGEDGASGEEGGGGGGAGEVEKKFPCPIEGCGKVYKQANGLKYHLTRSINSGHGNVAEMGLPAGALEAGKLAG